MTKRSTHTLWALTLIAFLVSAVSGCSLFARFFNPDPVEQLIAVPGDGQVTLSWNDPANKDFDHCSISVRSGSEEGEPFAGDVDCAGTVITHLTNGVEYTFTVVAHDLYGNESDGVSVTAVPSAAPTAPEIVTGLTAAPEYLAVNLTWTNPPGVDNHHIRIEYQPISGSTSAYAGLADHLGTLIDGLIGGTTYTFTVTAFNDEGLSSFPVSVTETPKSFFGSVDDVVLNVAMGYIENVNESMEYSVDGGATWLPCSSGSGRTTIAFAPGNSIWVRMSGSSATERFLGTVHALTGIDLVPNGQVVTGSGSWADDVNGVPGESMRVLFFYSNIGTLSGAATLMEVTGYLSEDQEITTGDTPIFQTTVSLSTELGEHFSGLFDFVVPSVDPGEYYIGVHLDSADQLVEMVEENNASPRGSVGEFRISGTDALPVGAVKVVNSWGDFEPSTWENTPDGHYWISYESLKTIEAPMYYYYNTFNTSYQPTVLAVFAVDHPYRDECFIKLSLGNPGDPVMSKAFQAFWEAAPPILYSGHLPFPGNMLVLDISEFAPYINDYDVSIVMENIGSTAGTLLSYDVEFYSNYGTAPFKTINGPDGSIAPSSTTTFAAATTGSLSMRELAAIQPGDRLGILSEGIVEYLPSDEERLKDMEVIGVFEPGKNYNLQINGFGTGLVPPTETAWKSMTKLAGVQSFSALGILPDEVDNSATNYFPPVGSQANEGSCVAWAVGYYIHTYNEAREHNWDISSTSWIGGHFGQPDTNLEKIISPDFIYHQTNYGGDNGSHYQGAIAVVTQMGASSWQEMPYDPSDHTTWPSESAYREAPRYRGMPVGNHYWADSSEGYFIIRSDAEIDLLKQLLAEGYCVVISVDASNLYQYLDNNDVISGTSLLTSGTNHANTVVGYKEGVAWDPANPDG